METSENKQVNKSSELTRLRRSVHEQQKKDVEQRKRENPQKSEEEMRLGVYIEELEPQVRSAVRELNRKGYPTYSSGFGGEQSELQMIEGDYKLDEATQRKLQQMDTEVIVAPSWKYKIEVHKGIIRNDLSEDAKYTTTIQFHPATADLQAMTDKWSMIASKFSDRGHTAIPSISENE